MRRIAWVFVVILSVIAFVSGCGKKSSEEVVGDLSKRTDSMESYKSVGKMKIHTGNALQEYDVEVWYKQPNFYRVSLKNTKKDVTQILLRNEQGVFVLTPQLEKSFRFQSDWPENSGQVYLYQSLLESIIDDSKRKMSHSKNNYQFEVAANYPQNQSLKYQRIWMNEDYHPKKVEVLDAEKKVMVEVKFNRFEENASFDQDAFDMKRNMTGFAGRSVPTLAKKKTKSEKDVKVLSPEWTPMESELENETGIETPNGKAVIIRYSGKKPFTLTERNPGAVDASMQVYGKPIDLGFTTGVLIESDGKKRLSWTYNGTDIELKGALSEKEMTKIARSVYAEEGK
ncbi:Outer membrane lipoprotein-sorting protein [Marininema mesophilum]|uniref:Outer membrane lipoprotein-sorting protein n=1 Tax=Marininema mesophilum TaxID=1048340 RepID=A0A1H3AUL6_9BACL|nr:outer membrane lipoprotein carrier protein LolA [Marininema mesophilum]SDX33430.1 Outer membrane lipoprotein-sorting protein [Marininema mesophilum]